MSIKAKAGRSRRGGRVADPGGCTKRNALEVLPNAKTVVGRLPAFTHEGLLHLLMLLLLGAVPLLWQR
jgi:hypothetical protein